MEGSIKKTVTTGEESVCLGIPLQNNNHPLTLSPFTFFLFPGAMYSRVVDASLSEC